MKSDKMEVDNLNGSQFLFDASPKLWETNAFSTGMSSLVPALVPIKFKTENMETPNKASSTNVVLISETYTVTDNMDASFGSNGEAPSFTELTPLKTTSQQTQNDFSMNGMEANSFGAELPSFGQLLMGLADPYEDQQIGLGQTTPANTWDNWQTLFSDTSNNTSAQGNAGEEQKVYYEMDSCKDPPPFDYRPSSSTYNQPLNAYHHQDVNSYPAPQSWSGYQDVASSNNAYTQNYSNYPEQQHQGYNGNGPENMGQSFPQYSQNYSQSQELYSQKPMPIYSAANAQGYNKTSMAMRPVRPMDQGPYAHNEAANGMRYVREKEFSSKLNDGRASLGHPANVRILCSKRGATTLGQRRVYSTGLHRAIGSYRAVGTVANRSVANKSEADRGLARVVNQVAPIQIRYKLTPAALAAQAEATKKMSLLSVKPRFFVMPSTQTADRLANVAQNRQKTSPKFSPTAFELIEGSPLKKLPAAADPPDVPQVKTRATVELVLDSSQESLVTDDEPSHEISDQAQPPVMRSIFGYKKLKHRCLCCGLREATIRSLLTHVQSHRKPFCRQCCWIGDTAAQRNSHMAKAHSQVESSTNKLNALVTSKYGRKRPVYSSKGLGPKKRQNSKTETDVDVKKVENEEDVKKVAKVANDKDGKKSPPVKVRSYFLRHSI